MVQAWKELWSNTLGLKKKKMKIKIVLGFGLAWGLMHAQDDEWEKGSACSESTRNAYTILIL